MQYPCFSSTARNLGTNCLITFWNGSKSVVQSFHTAFIFVFNSSSELNGSQALPGYTSFLQDPKRNNVMDSHQVN